MTGSHPPPTGAPAAGPMQQLLAGLVTSSRWFRLARAMMNANRAVWHCALARTLLACHEAFAASLDVPDARPWAGFTAEAERTTFAPRFVRPPAPPNIVTAQAQPIRRRRPW